MTRFIQLVLLLAALLLAGGCPVDSEEPAVDSIASGSTAETATAATDGKLRFSNDPIYPIPVNERPYQDVHPSVKQAWFLVETAYYVIKDKYINAHEMMDSDDPATRERGSMMRQQITDEIEQGIFQVNESIEALFEEAIDAEPDNPLNYASYAFYLKPRKRPIEDSGFADTESEALELMDQAIELWPDESSFYLLKVNILADPHQCHDWLRSQMAQQLVIHERLELMMELLDKAEEYYPGNHYINYRKAMLLVRYTPPDEFHLIRDEVLAELKVGNQKPDGFFNFPPPLLAYPTEFKKVRLSGRETEAKYIDHWNFFGRYDPRTISMVVEGLMAGMTWPEDKDDAAALMYFLYQIGRTRPYDRSMFSLQLKVIDPLQAMQEKGSDEEKALADAARFLTNQYHSVAVGLYERKLIADATRTDVRGINDAEIAASHMKNLKVLIQGPQAAYLQRAGEILGIDFPLPENPKLW